MKGTETMDRNVLERELIMAFIETVIVDNDKSTPAPPEVEAPPQPTFASLVVRIEYTLEDPRNGVVFVQKDDEIAPYVRCVMEKKIKLDIDHTHSVQIMYIQ